MQINATSTLAQCFPCSPNCVACTSATNCTICASNAYFNSTNNNCTVCNISSNCLTCNITYDKNGPITSCTACLPGFSLYINGSSFGYCQTPCPVNCLTCFNSTNTPLNNNLTDIGVGLFFIYIFIGGAYSYFGCLILQQMIIKKGYNT
mgnify:CR=1 FL=1